MHHWLCQVDKINQIRQSRANLSNILTFEHSTVLFMNPSTYFSSRSEHKVPVRYCRGTKSLFLIDMDSWHFGKVILPTYPINIRPLIHVHLRKIPILSLPWKYFFLRYEIGSRQHSNNAKATRNANILKQPLITQIFIAIFFIAKINFSERVNASSTVPTTVFVFLSFFRVFKKSIRIGRGSLLSRTSG